MANLVPPRMSGWMGNVNRLFHWIGLHNATLLVAAFCVAGGGWAFLEISDEMLNSLS